MTQDELYQQFLAGAGKLGWKAERGDLPNISDTPLLPRPEDIFKALEAIEPKKVKYLVLGQDPYPTQSKGVPNGVGSPDLKEWREKHQVLLLNAALTVKENCAGSHMRLWRNFTLSVIRQAKCANPDVQLIAWGTDATVMLIEALNLFTWSHHPAARAGGDRSFSSFWNTPVGMELRNQG
jgi:uracil DNA glycosylase